jgi:hypothetical protein
MKSVTLVKEVDAAELADAIMLLMSLTEVKDVIGNGSIMVTSKHIEAINVLFREMLWMRSKIEDCPIKAEPEPEPLKNTQAKCHGACDHMSCQSNINRFCYSQNDPLENCTYQARLRAEHEEKPEPFEPWARRQFEKTFALLKEDDRRLNELEKGDIGHE